jgi:hypothetical protein
MRALFDFTVVSEGEALTATIVTHTHSHPPSTFQDTRIHVQDHHHYHHPTTMTTIPSIKTYQVPVEDPRPDQPPQQRLHTVHCAQVRAPVPHLRPPLLLYHSPAHAHGSTSSLSNIQDRVSTPSTDLLRLQ